MDKEEQHRQLSESKSGELKGRRNSYPSTEFQGDYDSYIIEEELNLSDYIAILRRRKWIIISCFVLSVVIVLLVSLNTTPLYKAEITIEISPENPKITSFKEVVELDAPQTEYYETQYKLIKSKSLAEEVAAKLNLPNNPEFAGTDDDKIGVSYILSLLGGIFSSPGESGAVGSEAAERAKKQKLIDNFIGRIDIEPDRKSRLVNVGFLSRDPEFAAQTANMLGDQYIEWMLDRKLDATKSARKFLEKQLAQVKAHLEKAEEELNLFAKNSDIISLDKNLNLTFLQLSELNGALSEAENERLAKQAYYEEVQNGNYEFLPQIMNDTSIQALNEEYTKAKSEYDNLAVIYGPNYPDLQQLGAKVSRIQSDIQNRINGIAESIKEDYLSAKRKEDILRQRNEEQKSRASDLNDKAIQYKILAREVETNKSLYENLLQRFKETEVTSAIRATNIQVVDYAAVPIIPHSPNIRLNLILAAFMGLGLGVILSFVTEHFDSTLKDEEELKNRFSISFLGGVPVAGDDEIKNLEKIVHISPMSAISESFRVIRTSVLFASADRQPKSILVTSSQPFEGKTTITSNLAISFTQSGHRVVMIDADMRRPRLSKLYPPDKGSVTGLSTYLIGKFSLEETLKNTEIDGLSIIHSGIIPPNPSELLGSEKMKELIRNLEKEYDIVLIDAPPTLGFADSLLIARAVDRVLIITSVGITQRKTLQMGLEELRKVRGKVMGAIVNRLESSASRYRYNYYYSKKNEKVLKIQKPGISSDHT